MGAGRPLAALAATAGDVEVLASSAASTTAEYVLPVGPSCPFRSATMRSRNIDSELAQLVSEATRHSGEFAQLAAAFGAGISPDKARARQVGTDIARQADKLKSVLDELEQSKDFQAMESYHTLQKTAQRLRMPTLRTVQQLVSWQGHGLLSFAENRPLSPMPAGVDAAALSAAAPGAAGGMDPSKRMVFEPALPRALPFSLEDFDEAPGEEAKGLKVEFERLVREHEQLVGLGATFGDFDTAGKEFYLDQMSQVTFRWGELMDDAKRLGLVPSRGFQSLSEEYLGRAGLSARDYRQLVDEVHDTIRQQVAKEALR